MNTMLKMVMPYDVERIASTKKNDPVSNVLMGSVLINNLPNAVFFKFYPLHSGNRGLLNEIIGYLYGTVSNVPQPDFAGVALVPTAMLRPFYSSLTTDMQGNIEQNEVLPAFFTKAVTSTQYELGVMNEWLHNQILRWQDFHKSVVFDEIIANTDRYPRNLIHTGNYKFRLIDNGFLATEDNSYPNWKASQLNSQHNYENQLANVNQRDIEADSRKCNRFIKEAEDYFLAYPHLLPEMQYWIDNFATEDKKDWQSFLDFLQWRTENINDLLATRYGLLG